MSILAENFSLLIDALGTTLLIAVVAVESAGSLLKDTSLGYIVAYTELLYRGQVLSAYNHLLIQTFLVVTVVYLVFNGSLTAVASRLQRSRRTPALRLDKALPLAGSVPAAAITPSAHCGTEATDD